MAARLPGGWPRGLALAATVARAAARPLWLPISANRLQLAAQAADRIASFDPAAPLPVLINANTFWLYTFAALAGIALMGAALAGAQPTLGWPWPGYSSAPSSCTTGRRS